MKIIDYTWAIDYSESIGQENARIAPQLFTSGVKAYEWNKKSFPKGKVFRIKIKIVK